MNATRHDLEIQFKRVIDNGWLPWFQREAKRANTTTAHLLAIGSRETNLKNIRGDFRGGVYHGYGIMQVDIGTDPAYCRSWTPQNVEPSIRRGTDIYLKKVSQIAHNVGQKQFIGSHAFIGKAVEPDDIRRIATAAYNCGLWAYYHFSRGENVDSTTTGGDYSRDVYDRAIEFADILEKEDAVVNAVAFELDAQGKYARESHQQRFNHLVIDARSKAPVVEPQEAEDTLAQADYGRDDTTDSAASVSPFDSPAIAPTDPQSETPPTPDDSVGTAPVTNAQQPVNTGDAQISQTQTVDALAGTTSTTTQFAAPATDAPGILDHVNQLGDKFQGLQGTLDKFGIQNPLASTSFGTWFMLIIKVIFGGAAMAAAFVKDNWEWLILAGFVFAIVGFLYNESRKRVAAEKAGVPEDIVRAAVAPAKQ